jgi:hypothetical protein
MLLSYDSDNVNILPSYIKSYIQNQYTNKIEINQYLIFKIKMPL